MSPIKVNSLTEEQEARFPEFIKKWIGFGLSTAPTNKILAEEGFKEAYQVVNLPHPKTIWLKSPLGGALFVGMIEKLKNIGVVWDSVRNSVWGSVRDSVWGSVRDSVWDSVWDSVRNSVKNSVWGSMRDRVWDRVWDSVWDSVGGGVRDNVWGSVWNSVWDSVRDSVRDNVNDIANSACFGQHDAYWLVFYDFFRTVCGLEEETNSIVGLIKTAQACGWWWPRDGAVVATERPVEINLDKQGKLHCDRKPALLYGDGWGLYRWHGITMPSYYIETSPDQIDLSKVFLEENTTVRMAVIQKCGFLRLKNDLHHELISKTESADLLEFTIMDRKVRGLHVRWKDKFNKPLETIIPVPKTKEQFGEDCPEDVDNAEQVRRWTLFMKPEEKLVMET